MSDCVGMIEQSNGRFFTVCFTKKDGSERVLNGRLGVTYALKGGECTLDRSKFLIVYDMAKKTYRAVNRDSIKWVNFDGVKFVSNTESQK